MRYFFQGSRVFESPKNNIWCSPPASALPTPTAFLNLENKRKNYFNYIHYSLLLKVWIFLKLLEQS